MSDARYAHIVAWFDSATCRGEVVRHDGTGRMRFHSTSFAAANSLRWPREGERVEVVLTRAGQLLSVHSEAP